MENKVTAVLILASTLVAALLTFLATATFHNCASSEPTETQKFGDDTMEYIEKTYDAKQKVVLIRAALGRKCLVVPNVFTQQQLTGHPIKIMEHRINHQILGEFYGKDAQEFCKGLSVHLAKLDDVRRPKRETAADTDPKLDNECQDQMLVDCGKSNSAVYSCTTGPAGVYRAQTTCKQPNQFSFTLTRRCREGQRFSKCLAEAVHFVAVQRHKAAQKQPQH